MMAATLAKGTTVIKNAAMEPEVGDLARFLVAMGAQIEGIDSEILTIHGVPELKPASYTIMSDRIEAGTYLAAAAITRGEVTLTNAPVPHLTAVLGKFTRGGSAPQRRTGPHQRASRRRPHRGGYPHPPLPRLPHRHAGAVHGLDERG